MKKLAEKYTLQKRKTYTIDELQTKSEDFIKDYPVVLSTTYSLRTCLSKDVMYDYVIVESAFASVKSKPSSAERSILVNSNAI